MGSVVRCNQARMLDFVFHPLQTIKASCIFQRCCLVLSMTLKGSHGFRTSCNVPGFARWGNGRDVCAAPAPVAGYIAPVPAGSVAPEPAARAAPAPAAVAEHFAPAPLRSACAIGGVDRAYFCSQHVRQWWSTSHQPFARAPTPAVVSVPAQVAEYTSPDPNRSTCASNELCHTNMDKAFASAKKRSLRTKQLYQL